MKKAFSLFVCLALLFLTACGSGSQGGDNPPSETDAAIQPSESFTAEPRLSANDTYGDSRSSGSVPVRDESVQFRTKDSYALEPIAVDAAEKMLRDSLSQPDSLQIRDCVVSGCADDGECVYYDVSFFYSYSVAFDQQLDDGSAYAVGVRKQDKSPFDASENIRRVRKAYSIYQKPEYGHTVPSGEKDTQAFSSAAEEFALSHLKKAQNGSVLSSKERPDLSGQAYSVWEVLCEGENDFGMRIPEVYTVFLARSEAGFVEVDPADPDANFF